MTAIILRRRKLGRGSAAGIANVSTTGIKQVRNWHPMDAVALNLQEVPPSYVFRWGCVSDVPANDRGYVTVNTPQSIHWCSDKRQGRLDMQEAGVPVPKTWDNAAFLEFLFAEENEDMYILRPTRHAQGRHLWANTWHALKEQLRTGWFPGYVSEYIAKVAEYRVFVCQNRAVWVAKKTPGNPDDVAWNVARGGSFENVTWGQWPLAVVKAALAAAKVSGTDFSGVDVMVDAEGKPYVLEVNSAPSQTSPYRQQCVAKAFDHIVTNGKGHFPDVPDTPSKTWKSYIHPSLWKRET